MVSRIFSTPAFMDEERKEFIACYGGNRGIE
jgi:hypothetical protein